MPASISSRPIVARLASACCARLLAKRVALSAALPARARCGIARQAFAAAFRGDRAQAACGHAASIALAPAAPAAYTAHDPRCGCAQRPRRIARRLRQRRDGARDQRGDDRRADAARHRGVLPSGAGCCGSLVHHMGREDEALAQARANIDAWTAIEGLDAIVINTSGCGTTVKDYGLHAAHRSGPMPNAPPVSRASPGYRRISRRRAAQSRGTHARARRRLPFSLFAAARAARCAAAKKKILAKLGFVVKDVPEGSFVLRLGRDVQYSAARYPRRLRERKVRTIERLRPDVIAAGNIGCITQIAAGTQLPAVHTVELIDLATGGRCPPRLREHQPHAQCARPRRRARAPRSVDYRGAMTVSHGGPTDFTLIQH